MMESQFSPALVEEHLGMLARRNIDGDGAVRFLPASTSDAHPQRGLPGADGRDAPGFRLGVL